MKASLSEKYPDLVKEWHPIKNGELTPSNVSPGSGKKVWWYLPYDDPKTGKHFEFEWEATVASRVLGCGCPYLTGSAVWKGYNDLGTLNPKLASEWHPTKNGELTPYDVTVNSGKKVWWYLPYEDPETGKHFEFEWEMMVASRTRGYGCPYLSGRAVWKGYNDLGTLNPKLASEWHPTKNGKLTPYDVTVNSSKKVWWYLPYEDPATGKHFEFEWEATISHRVEGNDCPYLTGKAVWKGYNDLGTLNPELAVEWHPTKNGKLTPYDVTAGSNKRVWWYLPYDDPATGKHFEFEWESTIIHRVQGSGCLYLSGHAAWKGYNDLGTLNPTLAAEWHPIKNGKLTPYDVVVSSEKKVWWYLPYDDPATGKHFEFEWEATVYNRMKGSGCPYLSGHAVWKGYNDLGTLNPELAAEWHPTKNGRLTSFDVALNSRKKVWWYCDCGYEWRTSVIIRSSGCGCKMCKS